MLKIKEVKFIQLWECFTEYTSTTPFDLESKKQLDATYDQWICTGTVAN